jgi:hypothetical protein
MVISYALGGMALRGTRLRLRLARPAPAIPAMAIASRLSTTGKPIADRLSPPLALDAVKSILKTVQSYSRNG